MELITKMMGFLDGEFEGERLWITGTHTKLVPDMASFVGGLVMDSNKILPFLGTASEWCNGEGSSQQFSSSSNSNPRINQNLPRDHHPGYTPQLVHTSKIDTDLNQLKKKTSIIHTTWTSTRKWFYKCNMLNYQKHWGRFWPRSFWSFSSCCDIARIVNSSNSRWDQIKKKPPKGATPPSKKTQVVSSVL